MCFPFEKSSVILRVNEEIVHVMNEGTDFYTRGFDKALKRMYQRMLHKNTYSTPTLLHLKKPTMPFYFKECS